MGRGSSLQWVALLVLLLPLALAANDPGHDALYVVKSGDSNISGSINLTGTTTASSVQYARLLYGDYLDIRANGSIQSVASRPAIQASTNSLFLDGNGNVNINTVGGTTSTIQIGDRVTQAITVNVSGDLRQQGVLVCLQNGTNCPGVLSGSNVSGAGTTNYITRWTAAGSVGNSILFDDGTNVGIHTATPGATVDVRGTLLINSSSASLRVSNATATHLFVNGTTGNVGIGTTQPSRALEVVGTINATAIKIGTVDVLTAAVTNVGTGTFLTGGPITATGTINLDATGLVANIGNWSADKASYLTAANAASTYAPLGVTSSAGGWRNGTQQVILASNTTNVSIGNAPALFVDNANNRIGIGTSSPLATLHLNRQASAQDTATDAVVISLLDTGSVTSDAAIMKTGQNISVTTNGTLNGTNAAIDLAGTRLRVTMNNSIDDTGEPQAVAIYGTQTMVTTASTSTDGSDNYFVYGTYTTVTGNLGTSLNDGERIAGYFTATGTHFASTGIYAAGSGASTNYGGRFDAGGGTSNYGVVISSPGAGANNYALYSPAAAQTYFGGSVGIRDSAPASTLAVSGNLSVSGSANSSIDGATFIVDATNNRIGVGTTRPATALEVVGTINATAIKVGTANVLTSAVTNVGTGTFLTGGPITATGTISLDSAALNTSYDARYAPIGVGSSASGWTNASGTINAVNRNANVNTGALFIDNTNNRTGIGTTTPLATIHIRENTGAEAAELRIEQADPGIGTGNLTLFVGDGAGYVRYASKGIADTITLGEDVYKGIQLTPRSGGNVSITSGNLGVGTQTPTSKLHVVGEANISGISGDGTGKVVCIKSDGNLGTCSSAVGAGGTCTCG